MASSSSRALTARSLYTAASANRNSHVVDWTRVEGKSVLAYASAGNVVIAEDPDTLHPPPPHMLVTEKGVLTVLKFLHPVAGQGTPTILAGSEDGHLSLFVVHNGTWQRKQQWQASRSAATQAPTTQRKPAPSMPARKAKGEAAPSIQAIGVVRAGTAVQNSSDRAVYTFASATSDGMMQIWQFIDGEAVQLLQEISLGRSRAERRTEILPLDISIIPLPLSDDALLLSVAGTDAKIELYLAQDGKQFQRLFALQGHTDWVRSLDFCRANQPDGQPYLMLASGAQDHGIRLWRIEVADETRGVPEPQAEEERDEFDRMAAQIEDGEDDAIATKAQTFTCGSHKWSASFDALLIGHEHWVTGVCWAPVTARGQQPAGLLSSSADNSVILWTPSSVVDKAVANVELAHFAALPDHRGQQGNEQDVWVALQRFGELGNVGSAANGMYGVAWMPNDSTSSGTQRQGALAHGYGGAIHIWTRQQAQGGHVQPWKAQTGMGGHFGAATTVRWEPGGQYIVSGGLDKTTRLHGCHRVGEGSAWHEMARPQTHGYEIMTLAWLSRLALASAGDEKVVRVFEAPQGFVHSAQNLAMISPDEAPNLLALAIPSVDPASPHALEPVLKQVTKESLALGRLKIAIVSPLFDGVASGGTPHITFEQVENFLKWCYAMSWSTAVEADALLFDVDVLLMGQDVARFNIAQLSNKGKTYIVDDGKFALPFEVPDAIPLSLGEGSTTGATPGQESSQATLDQHATIAMGGTFDHLHVGHKILLSMACLLATRRIVVGVTNDVMLAKKKHAHLLESVGQRMDRVRAFMTGFSHALGRTTLKLDVVVLQDVAGPAGTDADLTALLFTDETVSGADFIDGERQKRGLNTMARFCIGVIGASGETDVKGKDAGELAAAKVGSTAIRGWIEKRGTEAKHQTALPSLDQVPTLTGEARPVGASVPPLGLSNRAIYGAAGDAGQRIEPGDGPSASGQNIGSAIRSIATDLERPPTEYELHNQSLWSEVTKLYGHGLELAALDVDLTSGLVASSCRATHAEHAGIRLHDRRAGWREVQVLMGHTLNVTRLCFSPNGQRLVSVSRDRSWRLFQRSEPSEGTDAEKKAQPLFTEVAVQEAAHARIIYDVTWCGQDYFATVSRDGQCKVWHVAADPSNTTKVEVTCQATLVQKEPLTAVAALDAHLLAMGTETGHLHLYRREGETWQSALHISHLHGAAINQLDWQPIHHAHRVILASAGEDRAVRLTEITLS